MGEVTVMVGNGTTGSEVAHAMPAPLVERKKAIVPVTIQADFIGTAPIIESFVSHGDAQFHTLDHYTEQVVLQEGRHSVVESAWHTRTAQTVVIKGYDKASLKPRQLANVYREVRLLDNLNGPAARCPGVVHMLAAFEDGLKIYLVFKACMRGDLYQLLMKEPTQRLNEQLVASTIVLPLVLTLVELHGMQIVHRDIKPENVFIDIDGRLQLGDFGLAAQHTDNLRERVGTLDYMAPEVLSMPTPSEVAAGRNVPPYPYNEKVDIWAVGCLCYELLAGTPPFEVEDPKETAKLILIGKPAPFPSNLSVAGCDFIRQALAHKHSHRPSARQLLEHPWLKQHMHTPRQQHHQHHTHNTHSETGQIASSSHNSMGVSRSSSNRSSGSDSPQASSTVYEAWGVNCLSLLHIHEQQQEQQRQRQQQHEGTFPPAPLASVSSQELPPMLHASYSTSPGRSSNDAQSQGLPSERLLPPGHELSEASSNDEASEVGASGAKGAALRPGHNRRASSGTSEYLTYNTPRCGSPEHMSRSASVSTSHSPFLSLTAAQSSQLTHSAPLRCTTSCNGSVEGNPATEPEPQAPMLTWQSSAPACKKAVGKSRFAK